MVPLNMLFQGNALLTGLLTKHLYKGDPKCEYAIGTDVETIVDRPERGIPLGTRARVVGNGWLPNEALPPDLVKLTGMILTNDAYLLEVPGLSVPVIAFNSQITKAR